MGTNTVDLDQTAPIGAVWSESTLFVKKLLNNFSRRQKKKTFDVDGAFKG